MIQVFKIGGNVIESDSMLEKFCREFAAVPSPRILVHGGGVSASALQTALGQTPVKIEGRRVTDENALKVVVMMYAGWCNKLLVSKLQKYGCNAIGLSGCDGNVIKAPKRPPCLLSDGKTLVDFGYVGEVMKESVNISLLNDMLSAGLVPVLSPVNHDGNGQLLNTNADSIASSVAAALGARLVLCFEMDGVLYDRNDPSSVIPEMNEAMFRDLISGGVISEGMIPKISGALRSLEYGACQAVIKSAARISDESGTRIVKM